MCGVGMGVVARSKIGSGAGEVSSTWVDVKGPDLHVCMCVCVCVCACVCIGVGWWDIHGSWGLWERLPLP